jgi:hypothetical protein
MAGVVLQFLEVALVMEEAAQGRTATRVHLRCADLLPLPNPSFTLLRFVNLNAAS